MRRRTTLLLIPAILVLYGTAVSAVSFPVHDQQAWNAGTFDDTTVSGGALQLAGSNTTGTYTSQIFDAGDAYPWSTVNVSAALNGGSATLSVAASNDSFTTVQGQETLTLNGGDEGFNISALPDARYIRFNYTLTGSTSPTVDYTNITLGADTAFLIRNQGCQQDEKPLFSLSNTTNAHAANPGYYDYTVCASGINRSAYDNVCTSVETPTLSFFERNESYVHLSTESDQFEYKLCTGELSIGIRATCPDTTKAIVSIHELPESHIGRPGVYDHQLCGAIFTDVSLMLAFHLGDSDTIYMNGTENPDEGVYRAGEGWETSWLTADDGSMVAGIVSGEYAVTNAIGYAERNLDHVFNVTQDRNRDVSFYVPFTPGDSLDVQSRIPLIRSRTFMDEVNPNFGLSFMEETVIRLTLELTNVDLVTDMVLNSGVHRLVIQNMGTNAQGEPQVGVNVTGR